MGRKGLEISSERQEQIKSMRREKKSYLDIIEFFHRTYDIKITAAQIVKVVKGKLRAPSKKRSPYKKRGRRPKQAPELDTPTTSTQQETVALIHQAYALHKKDFLRITREAIKES